MNKREVTKPTEDALSSRINQDMKLVKCAFCNGIENLQPFKNHHICTGCIKFIRSDNN